MKLQFSSEPRVATKINRGGSCKCRHISHSVHMLLFNDIVICKYVYMTVESQLAAFRFLKYQGQVLDKHCFNMP